MYQTNSTPAVEDALITDFLTTVIFKYTGIRMASEPQCCATDGTKIKH
jgi:hypothetical protein